MHRLAVQINRLVGYGGCELFCLVVVGGGRWLWPLAPLGWHVSRFVKGIKVIALIARVAMVVLKPDFYRCLSHVAFCSFHC